MNPAPPKNESGSEPLLPKRLTLVLTPLVLLSLIGLLLFLLFLAVPRSGWEFWRTTHAVTQTNFVPDLPEKRSETLERSFSVALLARPPGGISLPPPGGVDAFGLPASGAFETGSARSGDHPLSLSNLASYLPIWGYLDGQEVIVGGHVYHPEEQLVIRTPSGLCKARIAQIDRHCLVLRDEEGSEVRIPWPRSGGGSGMPANEVFVDPSSSGR